MSAFLTSLASQLNTVTDELCRLHRELGEVLKAEHDTRVKVWMADTESRTDKSRERNAAFHSLDFTNDIFTLKAEIAAQDAKRTRLLTLINIELTQLKVNASA